jgi:hypothetical protein
LPREELVHPRKLASQRIMAPATDPADTVLMSLIAQQNFAVHTVHDKGAKHDGLHEC